MSERILNEEEGSSLSAVSTTKLTLAKRKGMLDQEVTRKVAIYKGRVAHQSDTEAALITGKPVNHILHLLLSVFTLGLWIPVWIIAAIVGGEKRLTLTVNEYGRVTQLGP